MKKVLIIGASGFIGKRLVKLLDGYQVIPATRSDFDLADLEKMVSFFETHDPAVIVNLAADKRRGVETKDFRRMIDINQIGTLNVVEAASRCPSIEHLIFLGSAEEYGDQKGPFTEEMLERPASAYSYSKTASKLLLESLNRIKGVPYTYLRPSLVYGPGQGEEMFLPGLIKSLKAKKSFQMTKGEQLRDFIHVDDLCMAIRSVIENQSKVTGQVYNIGSSEVKSIREIAEFVGFKLNASHLIELGVIAYREKEIFDYRVSTSKIEKHLGWKPSIKMDQGVLELLMED